MKSALLQDLDLIQGGESQSAPGLAVIPLFRGKSAEHHYLSLHQALQQRVIEISEVSEGGSVPRLKVRNSGSIPVLLLDGEELRGAKQNRVLNTTVLVAGECELTIPVSCTESGRWSYSSRYFEESGNVMSPSFKAGKLEDVTESLRMSGEFHSDQGQVWHDIDELHDRLDTFSPTSALSDAYAKRKEDLDRTLNAFPLQEGQCGILAMIEGNFTGLDLVSLPEVWKDIHDKIIRSYVLDILHRYRQEHQADPARLQEVFAQIAECAAEEFKGVGLGTDLRLESGTMVGSALLWDSVPVHLGAYPRQPLRGYEERYHSPRHRSGRGDIVL